MSAIMQRIGRKRPRPRWSANPVPFVFVVCLSCLIAFYFSPSSPAYNLPQIEGMRRSNVIIFIVVKSQIEGLVNNLGSAWFDEVSAHSDVFFLVGDKHAHISRYHRFSNVFLLHVNSKDHAYPPLNKTAALHVYLGSLYPTGLPYNWMLVADSDTYIRPDTFNVLTQGRDHHVPYYLGRPLHHCLCNEGFKPRRRCSLDKGVNYCSGMGYLLSQGAFERMRGSWDGAKQVFFHDGLVERCKSSDTFVGWAMGRRGILCTPAIPVVGNSSWSPPSGISWGAPNKAGIKQAHQTVFCQNRHHQGGLADIGNMGKTYLFEALDFKQCLLMHPLKNEAQFRYVHFAMSQNQVVESKSPLVPRIEQHCLVGIGVFAVRDKPVPRDAIRVTWKRVADALPGLHVMFLIGRSNQPMPDHAEFALHRESEAHGDVLELDMIDSYNALYTKSVKFLDWGVNHTDCKYLFKTDDDSYLRALPLINFIAQMEQKTPLSSRRYFGKQWGVHGGRLSPVVKDPSNPWYGYDTYPHDFYPPFMSGSGYGLSRDLARDVVRASLSHPAYCCEDAGVGILVDDVRRFKDVEFYTDAKYFGTSCREDIVIDNPAFHDDFNIYYMYERDLAGKFCIAQSASAAYLGGRSKASDQVYAHPAKFHQQLESPASPWARSSQTMLPPPTWKLIKNMSQMSDEHGIAGLGAHAKDFLQQAVKDIDRRAAVTFPKCFTSILHKHVYVCLECSWSYAEIAVQYKCLVDSQPRLMLATGTYAANALTAPVTIGISSSTRSIAVLTHFSGDYGAFRSFLRRVGVPFRKYVTKLNKEMLVTCSGCDGDVKMKKMTSKFEAGGSGSVTVQIAERLGLTAGRLPSAESIAVVFGANTIVSAQFFDNVVTFVQAGESVYFPSPQAGTPTNATYITHKPLAFGASVGDLQATGHLPRGLLTKNDMEAVMLRFSTTKLYVWHVVDASISPLQPRAS